MDAVDILKVCVRRWYVMIPILLGAAGVSYQLVQAQETTYTAHAAYGLVQSSSPPGGPGGAEVNPNPLGANNDGTLIGVALEAQLNSRETQEELGGGATRGWGPGEVGNDLFYSVKIPLYQTTYEVRAFGEDEEQVRNVVDRVVAAAPGIADELQDRAGAPASGRYQPFVLAPTQVKALPSGSGIKVVVAVMGVGVLMGAAWSIVADRVLRHLGRRRAARGAGGDTEPRTTQVNGQAGRPLDQPMPPRSTEPEAHELAEAEPQTVPLEPVATPAGGPRRKPQGTGPSESRVTRNGQRRPQGKVAGPTRKGAQQRRRTGGE